MLPAPPAISYGHYSFEFESHQVLRGCVAVLCW